MNLVPEGFKENAKGSLDPISKIKKIDLMRDDLVQEIALEAIELHALIKDFKDNVFGNVAAFVQLSAEEYGAKLGGNKGNVTLTSYDGRYKIQRAYAENLVFDERLQAAKSLIDDCINRWAAEGINENIRAIINEYFQVDKEGNVNTTMVLSLRRFNIVDDGWKRAMDAISDSLRVAGTKAYVRIYKRQGDSDEYTPISLDMASV